MVLVVNEQSFRPLDCGKIQDRVQVFLEKLDLGEWQVAIVFVGIEQSAQFNEEYRGKQGPTDVLSFPFYPELEAGQKPSPENGETKDLGDIIVCPERITSDAEKLEMEFWDRLEEILAHGLVHLLGYDHEEDDDYKAMKAVEQDLLGREV